MTYLGIDPGSSGGLAVLSVGGELSVTSMPPTERDLWNWVICHKPFNREPTFAMIEKVSGYIGNGHPGSSMFKFGQSYGTLRMALVAAGVPFDEVTPQAWQKVIGIQTRGTGESKAQHKAKIKAKAQQLFPDVHVTLATADALLIAEYCRRTHAAKR